jgi:hypothetical protein
VIHEQANDAAEARVSQMRWRGNGLPGAGWGLGGDAGIMRESEGKGKCDALTQALSMQALPNPG